MKKLYFATCIVLLACVISSAFIIPVTTVATPENNPSGASRAYSDGEYIIKALGDRIVVYKGKSDKPYIETTTAVSSLPKDVQSRLIIGISYDNEDSMKKALDEFCS